MPLIDESTKTMFVGQVKKNVKKTISNWVQTQYPDIQRPSCPWCHVKDVQLHRCHAGPRKIDIIRAEIDTLWRLSTAMGQTPNMDTFEQRVTERVKQDHIDGLTRIEIACGACNPYFEQILLSKLDDLNQSSGHDRKTMWNMYKKHVLNPNPDPNPAKRRRVEPSITAYFGSTANQAHDSVEEDSEEEDSEEEDEEEEDEEEEDEEDYQSMKERILKDRQRNLNDFMKAATTSSTSFRRILADSYITDSNGQPLGSRQNPINNAYKAWMKRILPSKYLCGHFNDRCNVRCKSRGHPLHECPALKTHLAARLGRPQNGKNNVWKTDAGALYYKGLFLKK
jgi:hypothetical protein